MVPDAQLILVANLHQASFESGRQYGPVLRRAIFGVEKVLLHDFHRGDDLESALNILVWRAATVRIRNELLIGNCNGIKRA